MSYVVAGSAHELNWKNYVLSLSVSSLYAKLS